MVEKDDLGAYYQQVGQLIKSRREKAKKSQLQLSKYLGFESRISVANIESGKQKIHVHTLAYIAHYLKMPITELLPPTESKAETAMNPEFAKNLGKEGITKLASKSIEKMLTDLPSIKTSK
jgi:transcriptional regulator with XRE-family HTH domain